MTAYDVVVVGGRVAGASLALLLARAGLRVAVLERSSPGSDALSTHALMRAGVLQLTRWGLLPDVVASGAPPVRRTTFHYPDDASTDIDLQPSHGVEALYAPRRHVLDTLLGEAARRAGASVLHETTVTELLRDGTGRVTGVRARDRRGRELLVPATVTVGADGLRSRVAAETDAAVLRRGRASSAVLYRYVEGLEPVGYEWLYLDRAAAGLVPTNDGRTCVFVATGPERLKAVRSAGRDRAFDALLGGSAAGRAVVQRLHDALPVGRVHGWGGSPGIVRRPWGPGWALVGDAGYFRDPISAHGMTDALRDAELLADALVAVLRDGAAEGPALARYQQTRDRLSGALFDVTEEVAGYDWDAARLRVLLRRLSTAMNDEVEHLAAERTR